MKRQVSVAITALALLCALPRATVAQAPQGRGRQQRPGGAGPVRAVPQPAPVLPADAAMAKLTAEIMALRTLLDAGFTLKDVEASLGVLREMSASEQKLKSASEEALQAEKRALLAAGPESELPRRAGSALDEAARTHGEQMRRLAERLKDQIGERKAGILLGLIGMTPQPLGPGMGMGPGFPGGPNMPAQPGFGTPGAPPLGPGPFGGHPGGPQDPMAPPQGAGRPQGPMPPGAPDRQFGGPGPIQPGVPGQPWPGFHGAPAAPALFGGPRLTLKELTELMEQKLSAMRK